MFFFGTFEHSLDERGRIAIPARYRAAFVDGGVLRRGPEGCAELYTQSSFDEEVQRRLGSENGNRHASGRRVRRAFLPDAYGVELDRQGRILVPSQIRDEAGLVGKVLVIGCGDYLELWHPERWAQERAELDADDGADEELG